MNIQFEKVSFQHQKTIFAWLEEPHVKEFWDNSQGHKNDILNFIDGRKEPSTYANGLYVYWVGLISEKPYSLIMTIREDPGEDRPQIKNDHLSKTGSTYSIDYMIGDKDCFGKGLGAQTLKEFITFFQREIDPQADTFFIDPDVNNPRAKHVYEKAGFEHVGDFIMEGSGVFAGRKTHFLVKK
jgi:RimJ/RimL family protein N-acetyltransferase